MKISIDSKKLIADVKEDIFLFGTNFKVYAIYSLRIVESKLIKAQEFLYISDYVDADEPIYDKTTETKEEFDTEWKEWKDGIDSLKDTKHESMTLQDLLEKLEKQDRIL